MQQLVCAGGTLCIVKVFLNYHDSNITFLVADADDTGQPYLSVRLHNGSELTGKRNYVRLRNACHLNVRMRFHNKYEARVVAIGLALSVTQYRDALTVIVTFARSYCCGIPLEGACGTCGGCTAAKLDAAACPLGGGDADGDAAPGGVHAIVDTDTAETIAAKVDAILVPVALNSDLVPGSLIPRYLLDGLGSGKCSCFNDSSVSARDVLLFTVRYTTVEFLVRTCASDVCYGTMLSYVDTLGGGCTFAVLHQRTVRVVQGARVVVDTRVSLPHLAWAFVVVIMDHEARRGDIFIYREGALLIARDWRFDAVQSVGHLGLGRWQPSPDGSTLDAVDRFTGCIDQFRIWHR